MRTSKRQYIADLEHDLRELREFKDRGIETRNQAAAILRVIFGQHQPRVIQAINGLTLELRCSRCQTDEHHTVPHDRPLRRLRDLPQRHTRHPGRNPR